MLHNAAYKVGCARGSPLMSLCSTCQLHDPCPLPKNFVFHVGWACLYLHPPPYCGLLYVFDTCLIIILGTSLYLWKFHSLCLLLKLEACCPPPPPPPPRQTDGPVGKVGLRSANTKHLEAVAMLLITPNRGT